MTSAAVPCLWARHLAAVAGARVDVRQGADTGKRAAVATADHDVASIELWPCVPKASKAHSFSVHPDRVPVEVRVKGEPATAEPAIFYLHPEFKQPTDKTPADVADHDVRLRTWGWDAQETMHVFWAVEKVLPTDLPARKALGGSAVARINLGLEKRELAVCVPGTTGLVIALKLPVLVNTTAVMKGEELLWEKRPKTKENTRPAAETWKTDEATRAKNKLRRRRGRSDSAQTGRRSSNSSSARICGCCAIACAGARSPQLRTQ